MTDDTKSAQILARKAKYAKIERAADVDGRLIGVKRLTPSQQLTIQGFAGPELEGTYSPTDEDGQVLLNEQGKPYQVPKAAPLLLAAAVCEVDNMPMSFVQSRRELNAVLDMLDSEGLAAAAEALSKLNAVDKPKVDADGKPLAVEEQAKN